MGSKESEKSEVPHEDSPMVSSGPYPGLPSFITSCSILFASTAIALLLPNFDGRLMSIAPLASSSNHSLENITLPSTIDPITCIEKPKLYHIDPGICANVFGALANTPTARDVKRYDRGTTSIGWDPCFMELKRARGETTLELRMVDILDAANAILVTCEKHQGAGWAHLLTDGHWYLFLHGCDQRRRPLCLMPTSRWLAWVHRNTR